jgi:hypothetical protein
MFRQQLAADRVQQGAVNSPLRSEILMSVLARSRAK